MKYLRKTVVVAFVFGSMPAAQADLVSGFESGLAGWEHMGDVSVQTAAIGMNPTQGHSMVFVSTMCDRDNPPSISIPGAPDCATTINEHPYSSISSPASGYAREFLGLPFETHLAIQELGENSGGFPFNGEGGAVKIRFFASRAGVLSIDWNRIGADGDAAFYSLWSDDPGTSFFEAEWIFETSELSFGPSGVDLCSRYYTGAPSEDCYGGNGYDVYNVETGWSTLSVTVPAAGWYWFGVGVSEIQEGTSPTVLALDNMQFNSSQIVTIDVKPGSDSNCLNINGHGVIPVAILGSDTFDVTSIDYTSLLFGGLEVRVRGKKGPLCSLEYSNADTFLDVVCHFEDESASWDPGDGLATLTGKLFDQTEFEGTDSICVVP